MSSTSSTLLLTLDEVSRHNIKTGPDKSIWVVIRNKVYDLTDFLDDHPGGLEVLEENAGKDATAPFWGHSELAEEQMVQFCIGDLNGEMRSLKRQSTEPSAMSSSSTLLTMDEVSRHNVRSGPDKSIWVVIRDKVYDVTDFLDDHPGGLEILLENAGKDATEAFEKVEHSEVAEERMVEFCIGDLNGRVRSRGTGDLKQKSDKEQRAFLDDIGKTTDEEKGPTEGKAISDNRNTGDEEEAKKLDVLQDLGLVAFYRDKIGLDDARRNLLEEVKEMTDTPWYMLHKILSLDYRSLTENFMPLQRDKEKSSSSSSASRFYKAKSVDRNTFLQPMDVLAALFLCSSQFLQAVLAEKLFMCQLSIPLILPDPEKKTLTMLLGALRNIVCTDKVGREASIADHKCRIVTLVGFGKDLPNMEDILNCTIQKAARHSHKVFQITKNGEVNHFWEGMVDMAWFLPSAKEKSALQDITLFLNLRGDVQRYPHQWDILKKLSTLVITVVSGKSLAKLFQQSGELKFVYSCKSSDSDNCNSAILVYDKKRHLEKYVTEIEKMGSTWEKNDRLLSFIDDENDAPGEVLQMIAKKKFLKSLSDLRVQINSSFKDGCTQNFDIDENSPELYQAKKIVSVLRDLMQMTNAADMKKTKNETIPVQILWQKWVILHKEKNRGIGKVDMAIIEENIGEIRQEQILKCQNISPLMRAFISKLLNSKDNTSKAQVIHMLNSFKHCLDDISRHCLPQLYERYRKLWFQLQEMKLQGCEQEQENESKTKLLEQDCRKLEMEITDASMGLEHILREVGQIYEVMSDSEIDISLSIHDLPSVMADLLLSGQIMELLDGDASHVPLKWVTAVVKEVEQKVGRDKKVFVLSILGIQSSGKSTLLNAMFGLQFAVSAGRCTKGVYGQLIPACKAKTPGIDFIFVIDTEGLRAPEFGTTSYLRDHEIATFVVGLGDLTLINLKGELASEMQEVLQIVIHAFLRISQATGKAFQGSCVFVHQNVPAADAAEKNFRSQQRLQQLLDQMTEAAAKQEGVLNIHKFNEVIEFDVQKHVLYFEDLWLGSPPMASVNPGYSRDVQKLRQLTFDKINSNLSVYKPFSTVSEKLSDLWNSILKENFVFSFKNSIEIRAYKSLDVFLSDMKWRLHDSVIEASNRAKNELQSSHVNGLKDLFNIKMSEINKFLDETLKRDTASLNNFFSNSSEKEVLEQWRERGKVTCTEEIKIVRRRVEEDLRHIVSVRQDDENALKKHETTILNKARAIATELRHQKLSNEEVKKHFDDMWDSTMQQIMADNHQVMVRVSVRDDVKALLYEMYPTDNTNVIPFELFEHPPKDLRFDPNHIKKNLMKGMHWFTVKNYHRLFPLAKMSDNNATMLIKAATEKLFSEMNYKLKEYSATPSHFQIHSVRKLLQNFDKGLKEISEANTDIILNPTFKIKISTYVASYLAAKFQSFHDTYQENHDTRTRLKETYYDNTLELFKNTYNESADDVSTGNALCQSLKPKIKESLARDMPRLLAEHMRSNYPCFHTKKQLEAKILSTLIEGNKFQQFFNYINFPERTFKEHIKHIVDGELFSTYTLSHRHAEMENVQIKEITQKIQISIKDVMIQKPTSMKYFIDELHKKISKTLPVPPSTFVTIRMMKVKDFSLFVTSVEKGLERLGEELVNESMAKKSTDAGPESVYQLLFNQCIGCCEPCPFCRAQCSLTVKNHPVLHSSTQHMCQGLAGVSYGSRNEEKPDPRHHNKLVTDNCSTEVASGDSFSYAKNDVEKWQPYKKYKEIYPSWDIPPDTSTETSSYWKYVLATFSKEFAAAYFRREPDIPKTWKKITKAEALRSLANM